MASAKRFRAFICTDMHTVYCLYAQSSLPLNTAHVLDHLAKTRAFRYTSSLHGLPSDAHKVNLRIHLYQSELHSRRGDTVGADEKRIFHFLEAMPRG